MLKRFLLIGAILCTLVSLAYSQDINYWTCSMHPTVRADKPGKCPLCGMDLIPVYSAEDEERAEIYYGCGIKEEGHCAHCDEGKPDEKCICGEHSFTIEGKEGEKLSCPVCKMPLKKLESDELKGKVDKNIVSRVKLSARQTELGGIRTEPVKKRHLIKEIKTVGKAAYDPELVVAQGDFITALETKEKVSGSPDPDVIRRADDILNKSKTRLKLSGMSDSEIELLAKEKKTQQGLILPEDKAWVYADIYEYELGWIKIGQNVKITAVAYPGEEFFGEVKSINPVLDPKTRSAKVRIEVTNLERKLKPEMYVDVFIENIFIGQDGLHEVIAVPVEAVLDTGTRKIVYIDIGGGKYIGKEIKTGPEAVSDAGGSKVKFYPVLEGIAEGEQLVVKGNFLIDSQSQLSGGMSVLWGGAVEIKEEGAGQKEAPVKTEHKH